MPLSNSHKGPAKGWLELFPKATRKLLFMGRGLWLDSRSPDFQFMAAIMYNENSHSTWIYPYLRNSHLLPPRDLWRLLWKRKNESGVSPIVLALSHSPFLQMFSSSFPSLPFQNVFLILHVLRARHFAKYFWEFFQVLTECGYIGNLSL